MLKNVRFICIWVCLCDTIFFCQSRVTISLKSSLILTNFQFLKTYLFLFISYPICTFFFLLCSIWIILYMLNLELYCKKNYTNKIEHEIFSEIISSINIFFLLLPFTETSLSLWIYLHKSWIKNKEFSLIKKK